MQKFVTQVPSDNASGIVKSVSGCVSRNPLLAAKIEIQRVKRRNLGIMLRSSFTWISSETSRQMEKEATCPFSHKIAFCALYGCFM